MPVAAAAVEDELAAVALAGSAFVLLVAVLLAVFAVMFIFLVAGSALLVSVLVAVAEDELTAVTFAGSVSMLLVAVLLVALAVLFVVLVAASALSMVIAAFAVFSCFWPYWIVVYER
jgi:hypothetical protein